MKIAKLHGATVIATASRDDADFLRGLGADEVLDSRDPAAISRLPPADLVIDAVGGPGQTALFKLAKPGGQLIALSQPPSSELAEQHGVQASMLMTQPSGDGLRAFEEVFRAGAVRPLVAQSFPLSEVVQAWERQSKHGVRGKLVLIP